jgi:hypothetical protein
VQRVPVKIVLNQPPPADKPLRMGLSVEVNIDISNTSGPLLSSTLQNLYDQHKGNNSSGPETMQGTQQMPQSAPGQGENPPSDATVPDQATLQH